MTRPRDPMAPGDDAPHPPVSRAGVLAGRLARWSATRPWRVVVGATLVLAVACASLSRLHISSSLAIMLGTHSPTAAAMQRVASDFQSGDSLLLLAELPAGREPDESGRAELLAFGSRLEASLRSDPEAAALIASVRYREDPAFLRFAREVMLPNGALYLNDEGAAELVRRLDPARLREQFARNESMIGAPGPAGVALSGRVLRDPLRLLELIPPELRPARAEGLSNNRPMDAGAPDLSVDQRAILIHIGSAGVLGDYEAAGRLVDAAVRCSAAANSTGLRIEPAGPAAIARDSSRVIRRDSVVSCLVSVGLLYLLFVVFYRRWSAGVLIGAVAATGMIVGIGVLAVVMTEVSPLAAMIAALLAGLGTDYGIHYLSHYEGYREQGLGSVEASVRTSEHIALPIVTNCFTSIFGFLSLWPSKVRMLSDFAVMGTAGLIGALVAVLLLMPAALAIVDAGDRSRPVQRATFGRLADVVAGRSRTCMAASLAMLGAVAIAAGVQGLSLSFESDLTVLHPRPGRALDATSEVIRRFSSQGELVPIEVRAASPAALLVAAHDAATALDAPDCRAAGVTGVMGLHMLLPDPRGTEQRRALLAGIEPGRVIAAFDAALEESIYAAGAYTEYREFLRNLISSRTAPTINDVLDHPDLARRLFPAASIAGGAPITSTMLVVRFQSPLHDRAQRRAAIDALNQAAAGVRTGTVTVAGIAAASVELEDAAREGLPQSVGISLVLVLIWLTLVFRRPLDVLLALLPLLFAGGTAVLFIIAVGQKFNPINSVAIPLLDGIAVDAGVFLVSTYRAHGATRAGLRHHLRSTTHAVLLSVATTATGFSALCFTHTPAVRSLGLVSAVGIAASGVGALLLLMPILIRRAPDRHAG